MERLIEYLEESSFFTDPASGYYHNAFTGGLADHSLKVYKIASEKNKMYKLNIDEETLIITAICHDLCKVGTYKIEIRNRKIENDDGTYYWEKYGTYGFNDDDFPLGHGEKSVLILMRYIILSEEEQAMIRWHMGFTEEGKEKEFGKATKKWPSVLIIHTSDLESAIWETQGKQEHLILEDENGSSK